MSETNRRLTDQEEAQALRIEEMRKYREQQAAEALAAATAAQSAKDAAAKDRADKNAATPENFARIKVRGTKNDAESEEILQAWEKTVGMDAAANDGMVPPKATNCFDNAVARLNGAPPPATLDPSDTETELNGLIAECRFLMREIAFNSARLTYDAGDRIRFLSSAQSMALTAAKIGKTVAQLRAAGAPPPPSEEFRQRITVEHVQTAPARRAKPGAAAQGKTGGEGGRARITDSANQ
jgi:hypothetical protein